MGPALAQDPPVDPEIQRLENEKKRVELELDIEKKRAELFRLRLPQSDTKPLEGGIAVDEKFALPSQILAYRAMDEIVAQARVDLLAASPTDKTFVVFNEKDFLSVAAYRSTRAQFRALQERYDALLQKDAAAMGFPAIVAPEVAAALLQSVAGVTAFFRSDVSIKATAVSVQREAVIAALAGALGTDRTLVYPPLFFPRQLFEDPSATSTLMRELTALSTSSMRSGELVASFESKSQDEQGRDSLKPVIPRLKTLNEQFNRLVTALTAPDETTGISVLAHLLRGELLHASLAKSDTRILVVEVISAGGANKTTKNLFTGTKLFHSGGTVISFILLDPNGAIAFARNYWAATEFVTLDHPEEWKMIRGFPATAPQ